MFRQFPGCLTGFSRVFSGGLRGLLGFLEGVLTTSRARAEGHRFCVSTTPKHAEGCRSCDHDTLRPPVIVFAFRQRQNTHRVVAFARLTKCGRSRQPYPVLLNILIIRGKPTKSIKIHHAIHSGIIHHAIHHVIYITTILSRQLKNPPPCFRELNPVKTLLVRLFGS